MRELAEEAGLRVKQKQLIKLGYLSGTKWGTSDRCLHYYLLTVERELAPKLNREHLDFRWFKRRSLPAKFNRPTTVAIKHGMLDKL